MKFSSLIHRDSTLIPIVGSEKSQVGTHFFQMWHYCFYPTKENIFIKNPPDTLWCASIMIFLCPSKILLWLCCVVWGVVVSSGAVSLSIFFLTPLYDNSGSNGLEFRFTYFLSPSYTWESRPQTWKVASPWQFCWPHPSATWYFLWEYWPLLWVTYSQTGS